MHKKITVLSFAALMSFSEPTNRRLNFVCYAAAQAGIALTATRGIHVALDANPPEDGNYGTIVNDWRLKAGLPYTGECHQQTHLMNLAIQLIGVGAGNEYKTYASTEPDPTDKEFTYMDIDGDGTTEKVWLKFAFEPPDQKINNFEGSLEVPQVGWYYAVWPSWSAQTKCGLLRELSRAGIWQVWVKTGDPAGSGGEFDDPYSFVLPVAIDYPSCP